MTTPSNPGSTEDSAIGRVVKPAHPDGHFYSPVVDPAELNTERVWPHDPKILGIDFGDADHERILREIFPRWMPKYDYPERAEEHTPATQFHSQNPAFSWLDARTYFVLLNEWKPRRLIEVGSGFSTLLAADVNQRLLDGKLDITCIEPYPRAFLRDGVPGVSRLLEEKVQNVALAEFAALQAGDILFIDSSHVAKTGSDVNYLYFEVLPRLASGVRVHIHDIFLPHDYPREWVLGENRSWNEQYLLRALLMHSSAFRVVFGCSYAFWRFPDLVQAALAHPRGHAFAGGSIWIERT
ncbi:MAG: class I SAM-dependent methyltransferase [Xanthomonadaceae bacterium]|nr:class I SAM-dependent methyltransferase [Xanthomonadaceae bacterium]